MKTKSAKATKPISAATYAGIRRALSDPMPASRNPLDAPEATIMEALKIQAENEAHLTRNLAYMAQMTSIAKSELARYQAMQTKLQAIVRTTTNRGLEAAAKKFIAMDLTKLPVTRD